MALLKISFLLLLAESPMLNVRVLGSAMSTLRNSFVAHEVVPDVVEVAPQNILEVTYPSGVYADEGNVLVRSLVQDVPSIVYDANPSDYYTLVMTDPDAPSRSEPTAREYQHWLVGNIQGNIVESGEVLSAYIAPGPPEGTGLHRYVFLIYRQPGLLDFDEPRLSSESGDNRSEFSTARFAEKYELGEPIAGNFFQVEYEG